MKWSMPIAGQYCDLRKKLYFTLCKFWWFQDCKGKNGSMGEPSSFHLPSCINGQTAKHKPKQLSETSRVHLGSLSNEVEPKNWDELPKREKRTISPCLYHPIPQDGTIQSQEGTSQLEKVPPARRGSTGWLPSLSGHCMNVLLWFHSTQAGIGETVLSLWKTSRKSRGQPPLADMQRAWSWLADTCSSDKLRYHHLFFKKSRPIF